MSTSKMVQTESQLQEQVAGYLRLRYPKVLFHSDFGSGVRLAPGQAVRQKRQNGGRRAWPDIFIARGSWDLHAPPVYGLFIELKREGTRLEKKNGDWATRHIEEQAETLVALQAEGYKAMFAVGFDEAKKIIDEYLGGE